MNLQCFTKEGTLHESVWVATMIFPHSGITSGAALMLLHISAPLYGYDHYLEGVYTCSAPAQTLAAAKLFIGNTPLVFNKGLA